MSKKITSNQNDTSISTNWIGDESDNNKELMMEDRDDLTLMSEEEVTDLNKTRNSEPISSGHESNQQSGTSITLNPDNILFFKSVLEFIDTSIAKYEKKLQDLKDDYTKKKWEIDPKEGNFKNYQDRIDTYTKLKERFKYMQTVAPIMGGDNLMTLTNVVHNEAAGSNEKAKLAVAYAYLNRIKYKSGGLVKEPEGADISYYKKLLQRWQSFTNESDKLTFLQTFEASATAAATRLNLPSTDPTEGATHWVSPKGLSLGKSPNTYYNSEFNKYFPNWARSNEWVKNNPTDAAKWFDVDNFKEITVEGVPRKDFIFYKGVK